MAAFNFAQLALSSVLIAMLALGAWVLSHNH
jgi:hypothetical protein